MNRVAAIAICGMVLMAAAATAEKKPEQYAELSFTVVREEDSKPLRNASVVLHQVEKNGRQAKGGVELKTDLEGKASLSSVPYGRLRVQIIVSGFQTFGQDFTIDQPNREFTIKMKAPQQQYSIYDK